jgi:sec-independent protein translocase protein TatB
VFGLSFGELMVLLIVAIVVMGPKELPKMLRKAGQWAGKLRRMASDLRAQSGIDDALRSEGLAEDIAEIRKLARGEIDGVVAAGRSAGRAVEDVPGSPYTAVGEPVVHDRDDVFVDREREYPREGCDSYGALPDTAIVYAETLPASPLAEDPLYTRGEEGDPPPPPDKPPPPPEETKTA